MQMTFDCQITPVVTLKNDLFASKGVEVLVKREDLNHPTVSGNKFWKLKYNVSAACATVHKTILTFGGAFSNHLYATAAACQLSSLKSIGIVRGERPRQLSATLSFCEQHGMTLHFVSRSEYSKKVELQFTDQLTEMFGDFLLVPEGGSNALGFIGTCEFAADHLGKIPFTHLVLAVGTGCTMAGTIAGISAGKSVVGISVLKDGEFLRSDIAGFLSNYSSVTYGNWSLLTSYHHGGYAKATPELSRFIVEMRAQHSLPLDHVYTAKALWGLVEEVKKDSFPRGSTILFLHTGGLQGALDTGLRST
jgi:1-aminocyclopropane-1-carboxylate deaminase